MKEWRDKGLHLPVFMRDFHDQKDLFKAIERLTTGIEEEWHVPWTKAQVYVIDIFLWFMARHGYTLQKTRAKHTFQDIHYNINWAREERGKMLLGTLMPEKNKD